MKQAETGPYAPEIHPKGWGEERWIANSSAYCGKKLIVNRGKRCSVHYHKLKDETFFLEAGEVELDIYKNGYPGEPTRLILKPGDSFHIPPGLPHQFLGIADSVIFEFSTEHFEEDSYRLIKGD